MASPPGSPSHHALPQSAPPAGADVDKRVTLELLAQHRRSLAGIAAGEAASPLDGVDTDGLASVTLSKRHNYTKEAYDAGREAETFEALNKFQGFDAFAEPQ